MMELYFTAELEDIYYKIKIYGQNLYYINLMYVFFGILLTWGFLNLDV